ncbi:unnamed protein product [Caenorhabditis angaria]|uniref:Uncharacterized protein n=1 Tax=Caenorhabditis angaria TaxID=860376 RepID=A0A9P1IIW0_9PELO|nr:unnamed protein product [Caenorhabditis angaria]
MANFFIIIVLSIIFLELSNQSEDLIGIKGGSEEDGDFVAIGILDATIPPQIKKRSNSGYCSDYKQQYDVYCNGFWTDRSPRLQTVLYTFCPHYENKCVRNKL